MGEPRKTAKNWNHRNRMNQLKQDWMVGITFDHKVIVREFNNHSKTSDFVCFTIIASKRSPDIRQLLLVVKMLPKADDIIKKLATDVSRYNWIPGVPGVVNKEAIVPSKLREVEPGREVE